MDLIEFLHARIAEDRERLMFEHHDGCGWTLARLPCDCGTPDRLLAEVRAKWRIIELVQHAHSRYAQERDSGYGDGSDMEWLTKIEALEPVLSLLALPYAGHQDYRDEWRP